MNRTRAGACCVAIAAALAGARALSAEPAAVPAAGPPGTSEQQLLPIAREGFDVTLGALLERDGRQLVESPKFRAVSLRRTPPVAELDFIYLGPTETEARLASGARRTQLGLKLRAADGCNLVYVMWRIDPAPGLVVSIKRNPGASTHAACGARGYRNVRPQRHARLDRLEPGARHLLRAALDGDRLVVQVDGAPVWEGRLGVEVLAFDGPVGIRTDNARLSFVLRTP